jgi:hypothetical protein
VRRSRVLPSRQPIQKFLETVKHEGVITRVAICYPPFPVSFFIAERSSRERSIALARPPAIEIVAGECLVFIQFPSG